ncbi:MAG: hypothetical protein ACTSX7_04620 [Alphaproteobacteria bacterium]
MRTFSRIDGGTLVQQGENVWLSKDNGETESWSAVTPEQAKLNFQAMVGDNSARFEAWAA